jgi:hypothetical protein
MIIDVVQLSKDIQESRLKTIEYNERVLSGSIHKSEYNKHVKDLKEIAMRAQQWRDETAYRYTAHSKWAGE